MKNFKMATMATVLLMSALFVLANTVSELEPNGSLQTAQTLALGDTLIGKVDSPTDIDYTKVVLQPGAYILSMDYPGAAISFRDWYDLIDSLGTDIQPGYCYYPGNNLQLFHFKVCVVTTVFIKIRMNQDEGQPTNRNYAVSISADPFDRECDDTPAKATIFTDPTVLYTSRIATAGDEDWVKATNVGAGLLAVAVNNATQPGLNVIADLYKDPASAPIATSVAGSLSTNIAQAGAYYLRFRYADADTASRFAYNASIVYLETACDSAVVGITNTTKVGKTVTLSYLDQNVDSLSINWGDGTVSNSPIHTYLLDGTFPIKITGFNDCSSATATTQVTLVTGTFVVGSAKGAVGDTLKVPFYSLDYEGSLTSLDGRVVGNSVVAKLIGFQSGKMQINDNGINVQLGYFSQTAGTSAISIAPGDTIFYLIFLLVGSPGDSTEVTVNGDDSFAAFYFDPGNPNPLIDSKITSGLLEIFKNIDLTITAKTPNGVVVTNALVTVFNGDTTLTANTNGQGLVKIEVPYGDTLIVIVTKDTIIRSSINSQDPFIGQRIIVLLPVNGLTPYMIVATDVNCDGKINSQDISLLLRWIVGLIPDFPCAGGQLVFVPETNTFLPYPNLQFFNFSTQGVIIQPDATNGETLNFTCIIRGDNNSSASAGFTGGNETDDRSETTWSYSSTLVDGYEEVKVWANLYEQLAGGGLSFEYDAAQYDLIEVEQTQAQQSSMMVINDKEAGLVKMAFISTTGENLQFDHNLPFLEIKLRPKQQNSVFDLSISSEGAIVFDGESNATKVILERTEGKVALEPSAPKVYPNPANEQFFVSLPAGAGHIEVYDVLARKVFESKKPSGYQVSVPTTTWIPGAYTVRITVGAVVYTHMIAIYR